MLSKTEISMLWFRVYEIQSVVRGQLSNGSFLLSSPGQLVPNPELTIYTEIDPFFLLIDSLIATAPEEGPFIDYIDCMNGIIEKSPSSDMQTLIQVLNTSCNFKSLFILNFCESRNAMDRDLVRLCRGKLFDWLVSKVHTVTKYLIDSDLYLVEVAGNPQHLAKITALELVRAYISESVHEELVKVIGYNTDSIFSQINPTETVAVENEQPKNGPVKRLNPDKTQPSAKKQKDMAVAKACMKMTSFFKPK